MRHAKQAIKGPPPASHQPARQLDHTVGRLETRPRTGACAVSMAAKFTVLILRQSPAPQSFEAPLVFRGSIARPRFGSSMPAAGLPKCRFPSPSASKAGSACKTSKHPQQMVRRVVKPVRRRAVQRNVKMNAPFLRRRFRRGQRRFQSPCTESICHPRRGPRLGADRYRRQTRPAPARLCRRGPQLQGRAEMQFADLDAVRRNRASASAGFSNSTARWQVS